jgi:hypothetical protein
MCDVTTGTYIDVGAGVGGEVGAGVGAAVGDGVGLHAQTSCPNVRAYALSSAADPSRYKPVVATQRWAPSVQASKLGCGRLGPSSPRAMGPDGPTVRTMRCGARAARNLGMGDAVGAGVGEGEGDGDGDGLRIHRVQAQSRPRSLTCSVARVHHACL